MQKIKASGIIWNTGLARIGVMSVPDRPGIASTILAALGTRGINVEFIVQCVDLKQCTHIVLCVAQDDLHKAVAAIEGVKAEVQAEEITYQPVVGIVSVFGPDFRYQPGIAAIAFSALASAGINILAISTSISTVSCVIDGDRLAEAIDSLRGAFDVPPNAVFTASHGLSPSLKSAGGRS